MEYYDLMLLLFAFFIISMIIITLTTGVGYGEIYKREVKCYDKFGNEIKDTVCIECYQYSLSGDKINLEKCEK